MNYELLLESAENQFKSEPNNLSLFSNAAAFLNQTLDKLNWVGFYFFDGTRLTLGPFQGKVACNIIAPGKGVCGTGFAEMKTQVVSDVSKIENHIYCDPNSQSEVVVPIMKENSCFGVLDLDAPIVDRFDKDLVEFLEKFIEKLTKFIDFSRPLI
ncbi:GAF domain-containing protein [Acholeplasma equirhinis]|uniref:GAF domain-containing protein n=1 Tax=Acholeplasma equirhinis TaxID=555393 RepID=UPI00197AED68|nr:GAF domain-containing protein [Acholeplasma equirhinis]MBN3491163.1 GAF domain-containing protein [Acholeplasma equirhinis]